MSSIERFAYLLQVVGMMLCAGGLLYLALSLRIRVPSLRRLPPGRRTRKK